MFLNYNYGGSGSGGGGTTIINITGSTNNIVTSTSELSGIVSPKKADMAYVTLTKELYTYNDGAWVIVPTTDMFYNKLASLSDIGHVQLTSDTTSTSESVAITPKALNDAIEELRNSLNRDEWDDLDDGVDDNGSDYEWGEW